MNWRKYICYPTSLGALYWAFFALVLFQHLYELTPVCFSDQAESRRQRVREARKRREERIKQKKEEMLKSFSEKEPPASSS